MADNQFIVIMKEMLAEMRQSSAKRIMTVDEVAVYLGVSRSCIYRWTSQRILPHSKVHSGKIIFFDRQKINKWALQNEVPVRDLLLEKALRPIKKTK